MGVSTFHHHFRLLTGMSPLQYQKVTSGYRLRANELFVDGLDDARGASELGYEGASQFNREYGRFFGQPAIR